MNYMRVNGHENPVPVLDLGPESTPVLTEEDFTLAVDEHPLSPLERALVLAALALTGARGDEWDARIVLGRLPEEPEGAPHVAFVLQPDEAEQLKSQQPTSA